MKVINEWYGMSRLARRLARRRKIVNYTRNDLSIEWLHVYAFLTQLPKSDREKKAYDRSFSKIGNTK